MPAPARITMMLDSLLAGGAERIAVEVACALDRERFEPSVVVVRHGGVLEQTLADHGVPFTILGRSGRMMPARVLQRASRLVKSADLLQANKFEGSAWGALLARRTGVPLVTRDPMWTGSRTRKRTLAYRRWIGPVAQRIVTPSSIVARSIVEEGVDPAKVVVIPNGVPLDASLDAAEARAHLGLEPDEFVVGIIARLREQKRHDVLLRAFAQLREAGRSCRLCIIGSGEEEASLRALARELGLRDEVVWAGEQRDARRLARAFDVAVICSWWEGLPVAGLELMSAGTPVVATPVGALPEVMEGGVGVFVPVGDVDRLARALAELMDDPSQRRRLGRLGQERVRERYSFESMVESFARLYNDVLADAPAPGSR